MGGLAPLDLFIDTITILPSHWLLGHHSRDLRAPRRDNERARRAREALDAVFSLLWRHYFLVSVLGEDRSRSGDFGFRLGLRRLLSLARRLRGGGVCRLHPGSAVLGQEVISVAVLVGVVEQPLKQGVDAA